MPDAAVIFGGPSPEHDVSVLTGLQAARGLAEAPDRPVGPVRALFWSKTGEWYEVDPALEAESFLEGVPRGAKQLRSRRPPAAGSPSPAGGWAGPAAGGDRRRPGVLSRGAGGGRDPPGRPGSGRYPVRRAHRVGGGPRDGQVGLRRRGGRGRPPDPAPGAPGRRTEPPPFERPVHREAPVRGLVHRHRRGPGLRHRRGPPVRQPPSPFGGGARALPARPDRPADRGAHLAGSWSSRPSSGPSGAPAPPTSSTTGTSTWPARAWPGPIGSSRPRSPRSWRRGYATPPTRWPGWPGSEGWPASTSSPTAPSSSSTRSTPSPAPWPAICGSPRRCPSPPCSTDLLAEARQRPTHAYSAAGADGSVLRSAGSIAAKLG